MKKIILLNLVFLLQAYATNLCNDLIPNHKGDFYRKISTFARDNKQVISVYGLNQDKVLDRLKIDNSFMDVCEYKTNDQYPDDTISYLVYSNNNKVIFINDKAITLMDVGQGLFFSDLSYQNDEITLFYDTDGGNSRNYTNYKFTFQKERLGSFRLVKNEKKSNIEVADGYDLKVDRLDLKNVFLSNFNFIEIINKFDSLKPILPTKQPLYSSPSIKTKMYLIKGDNVEILEEQTDKQGIKWLHILYHAKKKDIKAWIPKSAVDTNTTK